MALLKNTPAKTIPFYGAQVVGLIGCSLIVLWLLCGCTFIPLTWWHIILFFILYGARMFGITGGYHRYLSHKSFQTSPLFEFVLTALAVSTMQRGPIEWASNHRHHHKHSDKPTDFHSPRHHGLFISHIGWLSKAEANRIDPNSVRDLLKSRGLVWLEQHRSVPPIVLAVILFLLYGWVVGIVILFFGNTFLLWHATFAINSVAHVWGTQRFETGDDSKNSLILAIITLGEGWHNNHHKYPYSERQGMYLWEIDITHYILVFSSWFRIVWDIKTHKQEHYQ